MTIATKGSMPQLSTTEVDLWPCTRRRAEGTLEAGGRHYNVLVWVEEGWCCKVRIGVSGAGEAASDPEEAALSAARAALADGRWLPFCIDPRDGEAVLATTLTVDMGPDAVDRFFRYAKRFLEDNRGRIDELLGLGGPGPSGTGGQTADEEPDPDPFGLLDFGSLV